MRFGLFFTFLVIFFTAGSFAQQIRTTVKFKQPDIRAKLSNPNVHIIFQDSQGFMWIGTDDGLNRFDGYGYKIYRNVPGDSTSLVKNRIQCIFEDSRGTLWVSTIVQGLHHYDRRSDTFKRITEFSQQGTQIMDILEDRTGNIWLGGIDKNQTFIARIDQKTGQCKRHDLLSTIDHIYTMLQVSDEELWLGTRTNGLYSWNIKTEQLAEKGRNEIAIQRYRKTAC
ncbi:MAG: two-component regulator propeller domain-containing protein [Cyclobacteriaceae bacterium]|nr:two-component regulator propeller domain-containing protein [Cyclobacteriaceae bacterium]